MIRKNANKIFLFIATALILVTWNVSSTHATPLTGFGDHLPVPTPNPGVPFKQNRTISQVPPEPPYDFTGTWSAPAYPDWIGTFSATGPVPVYTDTDPGTTEYVFTSLPTGVLPAGSFFIFGDVDRGSGQVEKFTLGGRDSPGSDFINEAWLSEPVGVWGSGVGALAMPHWNWDTTSGIYTIDGISVPGNPTISFALMTLQPIAELQINRESNYANFVLAAPIPEPSTLMMLSLAIGGLAFLRTKKKGPIGSKWNEEDGLRDGLRDVH